MGSTPFWVLTSIQTAIGIRARLQIRLARKRYTNIKRVYEYERFSVDIPRRYRRLVSGFLEQDFDLDLAVQDGTITRARIESIKLETC